MKSGFEFKYTDARGAKAPTSDEKSSTRIFFDLISMTIDFDLFDPYGGIVPE